MRAPLWTVAVSMFLVLLTLGSFTATVSAAPAPEPQFGRPLLHVYGAEKPPLFSLSETSTASLQQASSTAAEGDILPTPSIPASNDAIRVSGTLPQGSIALAIVFLIYLVP